MYVYLHKCSLPSGARSSTGTELKPNETCHDDVIKCKHFPRHWQFMRVSGEFPAQRPVTRSFDVLLDLCPNKRLSKQWWGWWFETQSCPLWRHSNVFHQASPITSYFTWPVDELSSIFATLEVLVLKHQITHRKNYPRLAMAQLYMKQRHPNINEVGWVFSKMLD